MHTLNATWEATTFCTYHQVNNAVDENLKVGPNEILLDNQADISIIRPHLLEGIKDSGNNIKINGVGGLTLTVSKTGYLPDFFQVYASEDTLANILSFTPSLMLRKLRLSCTYLTGTSNSSVGENYTWHNGIRLLLC